MATILNEETREEVEVPTAVLDNWMDYHEDTTEKDAEMLLYVDADGAIICECCGVNYNPEGSKP